MDERVVFALSVVLIIGAYQCYWICMAVFEQRKWAAIIKSGAVYTGTVAAVENSFARYGGRLNIFVRINVKGKGDILLCNWPAMWQRHSPYAAGAEAEVWWSPDYPEEFVFANEEIWRMYVMRPVANGKLNTGVIKFRFFLTWAAAAAAILLGLSIVAAG